MRRFVPAVAAALASLAAAALVLELWHASLDVPWTRGSEDAVSVLLYMKVTLQHAWPLHNPLLGAPFGQDLNDYPLGDPLQIVITKLIGIVSGNVAVVTNLFFLVTFPLAALSALWVFRRVGISTWASVACAVLFAAAPFHFFRGEDHLMIAAYYTVPLGAYLVLCQLAAEVRPRLEIVALALLVGLGFTYYLVFTAILLAFAVVISLALRRRALVLQGLLALAVIATAALAAHLPTWIYNSTHGSNPAIAALHSPEQSQRFGLEVPRLLLPVQGHRIPPLAKLSARVGARSPSQFQEGPAQALGLVGALALLWLAWLAISRLVATPRGVGADRYVQASAVAALAATMLGVAGGFSLLIAYTVSPLVRSWSRLSIVIAFFVLVAVGKLLDSAGGALARRGVSRPAAAAALCAFTVLAVLEQTDSRMVPDYKHVAVQWRADSQFAATAAARLPKDSFVFQLPYESFPETTYEGARPFLHTNAVRWSFGGMTGRAQDWPAGLVGLPTPTVVRAAAAAGASGLYLDRSAYPAGGARIAAQVRSTLGAPLTREGALELFDLRPLRAREPAAARAQVGFLVLHPVRVLPGPQLSAPQLQGRSTVPNRVSYERRATFDLVNPLATPRRVHLVIGLASTSEARGFTVDLPGGGRATFAGANGAGAGDLTLKPGHNTLRIGTIKPPGPFDNVVFSITRLVVSDPVVTSTLGR